MNQEYSTKTQEILEESYNVGIQIQKCLLKNNKFLKNLEDNLLITWAEIIVKNYEKKNYYSK
ncbi:MAG: hypothetical protein U9Q73_01230 [Nanoarchaeota archaeon]|nr:hypothetical protein [Nanoarchaeota archaeon]